LIFVESRVTHYILHRLLVQTLSIMWILDLFSQFFSIYDVSNIIWSQQLVLGCVFMQYLLLKRLFQS